MKELLLFEGARLESLHLRYILAKGLADMPLDTERFTQMYDNRNMTSHTYDLEKSREALALIITSFLPQLEELSRL